MLVVEKNITLLNTARELINLVTLIVKNHLLLEVIHQKMNWTTPGITVFVYLVEVLLHICGVLDPNLNNVALTTILQARQKEYDSTVLIIKKDLTSSLLGHEPTGLKPAKLNNNQGHILARKRQQKDENSKVHDTNTGDNIITIINDSSVTTVANKNITAHRHNKYGKFMFASPALLTTDPTFVIIATALTNVNNNKWLIRQNLHAVISD
ncbi:hypothetical protein BDC45DRAFT_532128 [Circinella umbellata]|nr:hypothetical protein BDC45DRAFT_532128 [Circinella umbellata]